MDRGPDLTSPVKDLGKTWGGPDDGINIDAENKRHRSMTIGLRLPKRPRRPGKHSKHSHRRDINRTEVDNSPTALTPSETIQCLLEEVTDEDHSPHSLFCQMDTLYKLANEMQWRETARWVKYEEDVEEGGERWSKPHVASLSLHSLFELRSSLLAGSVILDMDALHPLQVADLLLDNLVNAKLLEESMRDEVRQCVLAPHVHQHQKRKRSMMPDDMAPNLMRRLSMKRTFSELGRNLSTKKEMGSPQLSRLRGNPNSSPNFETMNGDIPESSSCSKLNEHFMKKIPQYSEAANILVGELPSLKYQITAFIRLSEAHAMGDFTEVPVPTRFIVLVLGPSGCQHKNIEIGRSMATTMVDEVFREVAYKARNKQELLSGIDEFLDQVTVLPPGEWDPKIRIEPPQSVPSQEARKIAKIPTAAGPLAAELECEEEELEDSHIDPLLQRTGRLFGGLIEDVKRKIPWYGSDFKDCLHLQCVASTIYLFLATLTPNVTFGGLLGLATDSYMATMECILSACIVGVLFALFSGQPLNILGSTGPMLVLEMILYNFCRDNQLDFLPFRAWIGIWTFVIIMLIVAFDLSALVRYITRFTEESFACLIAIIFIYEAIKKQFEILTFAGVDQTGGYDFHLNCSCHPNVTALGPENGTMVNMSDTFVSTTWAYPSLNSSDNDYIDWASLNMSECKNKTGIWKGPACDDPHEAPDVFFLSLILFFGTFIIAFLCTLFKNSTFFPTFVRQTLSDFAVLIAIVLMVITDVLIGVNTPKLTVPEQFKPTRDDRGWFINPISDKNPWWLIIAAAVPATLAVILIFLDQQITAVIVNRKENKLKKGSGYHLDMFVLAFCILICSLLGLPWYVAATVSAIAHVMSLKKESECTAPGEHPTFLGVREQRVTGLMVGILSGLSVLLTTVLKVIPMPVLYGVFLYMGVAALKGMQLIDRVFLLFMPAKYQPDTGYVRHVPIKRVHLFTFIQILCLIALWLVKSFEEISIVFPIMVLCTIFVRKGLNYLFEQRELKWLDDLMPEDKKRTKDDGCVQQEENDMLLDEDEEKARDVRIERLKQHNKFDPSVRRGSLDIVNISQEMCKTSIWMQLRRDSLKPFENEAIHQRNGHSKRRKHRDHHHKENHIDHDASKDNHTKPSFYIHEDDDKVNEEDENNETQNQV